MVEEVNKHPPPEEIIKLETEQEPLEFDKAVIVTEKMSMLEIHEKIMSRLGEIDKEKALKKLYPLEDFESHKNK